MQWRLATMTDRPTACTSLVNPRCSIRGWLEAWMAKAWESLRLTQLNHQVLKSTQVTLPEIFQHFQNIMDTVGDPEQVYIPSQRSKFDVLGSWFVIPLVMVTDNIDTFGPLLFQIWIIEVPTYFWGLLLFTKVTYKRQRLAILCFVPTRNSTTAYTQPRL